MLLEIYDKNTFDRVDIIRTYTFVQYTDYFNDVGTFQITVPITESSLPYLLVAGNFILFEKLGNKFIMGIIKYFHSENISTPTVQIKGYMLSHLLSYRTFQKTFRLKDKVFEVQRHFVQEFFISSEDFRRRMSLMMVGDTYDHNTEEVNFCQTGSDCAEVIKEMNDPYHYGFGLVPGIAKYNPSTGRNQNIMHIVFEQYVPTDRTVGNQSGNDPVMFDTNLNNVENLMYELNSTKAKTVAIVAGEDKGEDRKVIEVGDKELTDMDRVELYVDARDLQKQEANELEYKSSQMTGDETRQVVWNSASASSLQNVQITNFTVKGNVSVKSTGEQSSSFGFYIVPYLGGVAYPDIVVVNETIEAGSIVNFDFDISCKAEDNELDHYDSFVIVCVTDSNIQYMSGGTLYVESVPAQRHATTDEEYEEMLAQRGMEKLKDNSVEYDFEATVLTNSNNSFKYGVDYNNGDYVTVVNRNLGMAVKVQIVGVTKSITEKGEILDLIFGNRVL